MVVVEVAVVVVVVVVGAEMAVVTAEMFHSDVDRERSRSPLRSRSPRPMSDTQGGGTEHGPVNNVVATVPKVMLYPGLQAEFDNLFTDGESDESPPQVPIPEDPAPEPAAPIPEAHVLRRVRCKGLPLAWEVRESEQLIATALGIDAPTGDEVALPGAGDGIGNSGCDVVVPLRSKNRPAGSRTVDAEKRVFRSAEYLRLVVAFTSATQQYDHHCTSCKRCPPLPESAKFPPEDLEKAQRYQVFTGERWKPGPKRDPEAPKSREAGLHS